jgi:hypothetical protein
LHGRQARPNPAARHPMTNNNKITPPTGALIKGEKMSSTSNRTRIYQHQGLAKSLVAAVIALSFSACTVTLVQPYDQKLFDETEAFYKKAATLVQEGEMLSPRTDAERKNIKEPLKHPAHLSVFAPKYDALIIDSDVLILRAMANSGAIDSAGNKLQKKIEKLIADPLPSQCSELEEEFKNTSLTVKNYVDLKCVLVRWRAQHGDEKLTDNVMILKKANWEARRPVMFNLILAIQKAEGFKKPQ